MIDWLLCSQISHLSLALLWKTVISNLHLVKNAYHQLNIVHLTYYQRESLLCLLPQCNGITYCVLILITNDNKARREAPAWMLISLLREFAHYCRRIKQGFYVSSCLILTRGIRCIILYSWRSDKAGKGSYQAEEWLLMWCPLVLTSFRRNFYCKERWKLQNRHSEGTWMI